MIYCINHIVEYVKAKLIAKILSTIGIIIISYLTSYYYNHFGDGKKRENYRIGGDIFVKQSRHILEGLTFCGNCFISLVELRENNMAGNNEYLATFLHVIGFDKKGQARNFKVEPNHNQIYDKTHFVSFECFDFLQDNHLESISTSNTNFKKKCEIESTLILSKLGIEIQKIGTIVVNDRIGRKYILLYSTPDDFKCGDCNNEIRNVKNELEKIIYDNH